MRLKNKVALITGAGSGIGKETAMLFAKEGASVVVVDLKESNAQETAKIIETSGGDSTSIAIDVTKNSDCIAMIEKTLSTYNKLNVLVNSAGVSDRNAFTKTTDPEMIWDRVIEVNLKGTFLSTSHAVPEIIRAGGGSIINLGSIASLVGYPADRKMGFDPYGPSKGGVLQFTRNLAVEIAQFGIRVNCICPGHLYTNLTEKLTTNPELMESILKSYPMGRIGQPKEIAYAALFLASDESSFITGTSLVVDGGYTAQ